MRNGATSRQLKAWVNALLVDSAGVRPGSLVTAEGRITHVLADGEPFPSKVEGIEDLRGAFLLPAAVDVHCHFRVGDEPPREGFSYGSRAALAGGIATVLEHPQATPTVVDTFTLHRKLAVARRESYVDFGLWVGAVPASLDRLSEALEAGACGVKAFLCEGNPQFPPVTAEQLQEAMRIAAAHGRVVAVHAEWQPTLDRLRREIMGVGDWSRSRPIEAEVEAVDIACKLARDTGVRLHLVHLSSASAVRLGVVWRRRGADVSLETCPHYLFLDATVARRLGPFAKCMPPLRSPSVRGMLRKRLAAEVDVLASDHAPHRLEDRAAGLLRFSAAPSGLATNQFMLPAAATLLSEELGDRQGLPRLVELTSARPAKRFGLRDHGRFEPGTVANFIAIAKAHSEVRSRTLLNRIRFTPLEGLPLRYVIVQTVLRGETAYVAGEGTESRRRGRWLRWPRP